MTLLLSIACVVLFAASVISTRKALGLLKEATRELEAALEARNDAVEAREAALKSCDEAVAWLEYIKARTGKPQGGGTP